MRGLLVTLALAWALGGGSGGVTVGQATIDSYGARRSAVEISCLGRTVADGHKPAAVPPSHDDAAGFMIRGEACPRI